MSTENEHPHLGKFKRLLDVAVQRGLFQLADEVVSMSQSFAYISHAVLSDERQKDPRSPDKEKSQTTDEMPT